jgi:hypothetical protein
MDKGNKNEGAKVRPSKGEIFRKGFPV